MPASLFSLPLKYATERILSIPEQSGFTIILPEGELPKEDGIIENIVNEELDVDDPIAIYDVSKGLIKLNTQHPVIMNFSESIDSIPEGLQLMAIAEVVTEAYETGISVETAKETMRMRDRFLREMVSRHPVSATYIATKIRDSVSDSKEFEKSLHLAFLTLGFRVKQMGQSGKPEGVAIAPLGMRPKGDKSEDSSEKYQIIYDAKSTSKNKVAAKDLNLAQIDQFKKEYNANYAVVVAKDFEGGNDPTANAPSQAKDLGICLLKAEDFSKLVEISAVRMIPLQKLRTLFECTNPMECSQWLIEYLEKTEAKIDLRKALEILWKMQRISRYSSNKIL